MSDGAREQGINRDCVICEEPCQLAFWTRHFRVSEKVLLDVIERVGPEIGRVTAELVIYPPEK